MKKLSKWAAALGTIFLCFTSASASNQPTTFLGPTLKGGYTSTMNDYTAYSVLAEAGVKNFRAGGTLGWKLEQNQYLKVSAEYLWQNIKYNFLSGDTEQWVQQGALGAGYLYEFNEYCYQPHLDVNAYLSHAPSKTLGNRFGFVSTGPGATSSFLDHRRIAGSNAAGIVPAVSIAPWNGSRAGLGLNYDNVRYDKKYAPNEDAKGLGGTFTFKQLVATDVELGLSAAVRQPFNNYAADVAFANVPFFGKWVLDVDGEYTAGKNTLPNTWNIGLSANYALDQRCQAAPVTYKDKVMYKDAPIGDDLVSYTADPAVYLPQVLAIPDEDVQIPAPSCTNVPTLTGVPIPALSAPVGGSDTSAAAPSFAGSGITFSISPPTPALPAGDTLTINPTTGVITADNQSGSTSAQDVTATVTATTSCGSVSTTVSAHYDQNIP